INGSNDEYQSFYYTKYDHARAGQAYNISLLNRNLILSSMQQTRELIHTSGDKTLLNSYNEWISLKQRLVNFYASLRAEDNAKYAARVRELEQETDSIEKLLTRSSSAFRNMRTAPGWQLVQQSL